MPKHGFEVGMNPEQVHKQGGDSYDTNAILFNFITTEIVSFAALPEIPENLYTDELQ